MSALRVLVYPHAMELGGSQLNAIEIAAAVRDLGHDVTIISEDGPMVDHVQRLDLPRIPLDRDRRRPAPATVRLLRDLVHDRGIDIIHGYEWPPGVEAAAAVFPGRSAAAVCTVMSSAVAPFLPRHLPLVVGTEALRRRTAAGRPGSVDLIEPPVDVVANAPDHPSAEFVAKFGLGDRTGAPAGDLLTVAVVCRLVPELKLEGVLTAIDVIGTLARERPLRLLIVGGGSAAETVAERAAAANATAGWRAVVLTGELMDPRPAYAAADVMLGMGGSALRSLAFGKPLIVQGELGFWELLTPQTCQQFLDEGWYGIGSGHDGPSRLTAALRPLIEDGGERDKLGRYGRELAIERFSLGHAAKLQETIYRTALSARLRPGVAARTVDLARTVGGVGLYKVRRKVERARGTASRDDFNALARGARRA